MTIMKEAARLALLEEDKKLKKENAVAVVTARAAVTPKLEVVKKTVK